MISFGRRTKQKPVIALLDQGFSIAISAITEYEIFVGAKSDPLQLKFWDDFLNKIQTLPLDKHVARIAPKLNTTLKQKRQLIEIADLFICATAIADNLSCSTLNKKHFSRIDDLHLI